jgi:hypothetical protein
MMRIWILTAILLGGILKAGAEDIYVVTQPAVCCSSTGAARTFAPVVPSGGKALETSAYYATGGFVVWPQYAANTAVGIEQVEAAASPALRFDQATGNFLLTGVEGPCLVQVYTMDGRLLGQMRVDGASFRLDTSSWPLTVIMTVTNGSQKYSYKVMRAR